jgi:hypothetical protein
VTVFGHPATSENAPLPAGRDCNATSNFQSRAASNSHPTVGERVVTSPAGAVGVGDVGGVRSNHTVNAAGSPIFPETASAAT